MRLIPRRSFLRYLGRTALWAGLLPYQTIIPPAEAHRVCLRRARLSMGSRAEIIVYGESRSQCIEATNAAFAEFDRIERLMSVFDETSQLSWINQHAYENEVVVDPLILEVIEHAARLHALTEGAFDVTIEPLMRLYGFRDETLVRSFPTDQQICNALDAVGMHNVVFDAQRSTVGVLHPDTRLDFGGIAVGFAIDRAVAVLRSYGITSGLIDHSGDIFALGAPPDDDAWAIGIMDPLDVREAVTTVRIHDQALSTSGNYRHYVELNSLRIGHILDPRRGNAAATMLSGTIIGPTAIDADACATALFVLGVEKARKSFRQVSRLRAIAVLNGRRDILEFTTAG